MGRTSRPRCSIRSTPRPSARWWPTPCWPGEFAIFTHANDKVIYETWRADIDASLAKAVADNPPPPVIPPA